MNRENTIKGTMATRAVGTVFHKPLLRDAVPRFDGLGGNKSPGWPVSANAVRAVLRKTNYPQGAKRRE